MPDLGDEGRGLDGAAARQNDENAPQNSGSIPYQLLKSAAFEPRACKSIILEKLRVLTLMRRPSTSMEYSNFQGGYSYDASSNTNYHSLASVINFDSPSLVRALGSLLIYLRNTAFRLEEGFTVTVNDLRRLSNGYNSYLRLEDTALRSLRIFATDFHPLQGNNAALGNSHSKSKDGFSIYTLLDRTKSRGGKERLRQWMMQPLRDVQKIRERHVAMELFLHPNCHSSASLLLEKLANVGNMDAILLRMQRCCAKVSDFLTLGRMLEAANAIMATLGGEVREKAYQIDREESDGDEVHQYPSVAFVEELMGRCYVDTLRNLRERLASVVDEEVTAEVKGHVVIHYGYNQELDRAKETFETLDGKCSL
jgi:DNA mismatch repair ATPase MutS